MSTPPLSTTGSGSPSSTQEIPVVPAAVTNTQHLPPPPAAFAAEQAVTEPVHSTGPVDFVPEPPAPTVPAAARKPTRRRPAGGRKTLAPAGLAALAVVALELGLSFSFSTRAFWSAIPLWSAFATAAAVLGLVAVALPALGRSGAGPQVWKVGAGGLTCLAGFWLLVVLRLAATDRGFLLTAAVACLGAAVWLAARTPASRR